MLATSSRRRPLGRTIVHVALVLSIAFGTLAGAGGYWAVIKGNATEVWVYPLGWNLFFAGQRLIDITQYVPPSYLPSS